MFVFTEKKPATNITNNPSSSNQNTPSNFTKTESDLMNKAKIASLKLEVRRNRIFIKRLTMRVNTMEKELKRIKKQQRTQQIQQPRPQPRQIGIGNNNLLGTMDDFDINNMTDIEDMTNLESGLEDELTDTMHDDLNSDDLILFS